MSEDRNQCQNLCTAILQKMLPTKPLGNLHTGTTLHIWSFSASHDTHPLQAYEKPDSVLYQRLRIFSKTDLILSAAVHVKTPIREIITDLLPYVDKPVKTFLMGQSSERYDSFLLAGRNPLRFIDNKIGNEREYYRVEAKIACRAQSIRQNHHTLRPVSLPQKSSICQASFSSLVCRCKPYDNE